MPDPPAAPFTPAALRIRCEAALASLYASAARGLPPSPLPHLLSLRSRTAAALSACTSLPLSTSTLLLDLTLLTPPLLLLYLNRRSSSRSPPVPEPPPPPPPVQVEVAPPCTVQVDLTLVGLARFIAGLEPALYSRLVEVSGAVQVHMQSVLASWPGGGTSTSLLAHAVDLNRTCGCGSSRSHRDALALFKFALDSSVRDDLNCVWGTTRTVWPLNLNLTDPNLHALPVDLNRATGQLMKRPVSGAQPELLLTSTLTCACAASSAQFKFTARALHAIILPGLGLHTPLLPLHATHVQLHTRCTPKRSTVRNVSTWTCACGRPFLHTVRVARTPSLLMPTPTVQVDTLYLFDLNALALEAVGVEHARLEGYTHVWDAQSVQVYTPPVRAAPTPVQVVTTPVPRHRRRVHASVGLEPPPHAPPRVTGLMLQVIPASRASPPPLPPPLTSQDDFTLRPFRVSIDAGPRTASVPLLRGASGTPRGGPHKGAAAAYDSPDSTSTVETSSHSISSEAVGAVAGAAGGGGRRG